MNRLTEYIDDDEVIPIQTLKIGHKACMRKLAAYEDTGLEPKEIQDLIAQNKEFRRLLDILNMTIENLTLLNTAIEYSNKKEIERAVGSKKSGGVK